MKVYYRITDSEFQNNFRTKYIQIFVQKYENMPELGLIGTITYLQSQTDFDGKWFGLNYEVKTDRVEHIEQMAKLARLIYKRTNWDTQPNDMLEAIGAKPCFPHRIGWLPETMLGLNFYKVIKNNTHCTSIIAKNDKIAQKIYNRMGSYRDAQVVFDHVIERDNG